MYMLQTTVCPNIHSYGARWGCPYCTAYTVRPTRRTVTPKHTRILSCDRRQGCPYRKCTWCKRAICIRRNANGTTQRVRVRVSVRVRVRVWVRVRVRCTWIMGVNALRHLHCAEYRKPCKRGLFPNSEYSLACWMLCLYIAITSTCNVRGYVWGFGLSLFCNVHFM